jgi:hypothetical protein
MYVYKKSTYIISMIVEAISFPSLVTPDEGTSLETSKFSLYTFQVVASLPTKACYFSCVHMFQLIEY